MKVRLMIAGLVGLGAGTLALGVAPALAAPALAPHLSAAKPAAAPAFPIDDALVTRIKPLLGQGANVKLAADGFKTPEQFAAVAHASHDLHIRFVTLREKVLDEHMTLANAIAALQPTANATSEAQRAESAAKQDVTAAGGARRP